MSDEWGPWIEHDGKECPVSNGVFVHVIYRAGIDVMAHVSANGRVVDANPWIWKWCPADIIRYRIRKPRGLIILQQLVENLPNELVGDVG